MGNFILLLFPAVIDTFAFNYVISKILKRKLNWYVIYIMFVLYIGIYLLKLSQLTALSDLIMGGTIIASGVLYSFIIKYGYKIPFIDTVVILMEFILFSALAEAIMVVGLKFIFRDLNYSDLNKIDLLWIHLINNLLIMASFKYKKFSLYDIVMDFYSHIKKSPLLQLQGVILASTTMIILMTFTNMIMGGNVSIFASLITGVLVVCILFANIFLVNRALADVVRTNNLEIQGVYIDTSKQIAEDTRAFWHNYSNVVSGLRSLVEVKDYTKEEMTEMIEDLLKWDSEKSIKDKIAVLNIDNPAIKGIISSKLEKAKQRGINVSLKAENVEKVDMNVIEMIEVLGILLDNAIEFSSQSKSKLIDMELGSVQGKSFKLKIANTFIEKDGKPFKLEDSNNIGFNYINKLSKKLSNKLVFEYKIIEEAFSADEKLFEVNFII